jgi:tetratricopeptide (TPR) repeat protein
LRQFQPALDDYNQAVKMSPKNPESYANRGDAFRALGQWESAAADFRQAIQIDSKFGRAYQSASWLMATCPDQRYRNADLAVRAAERAIQLDGSQDYIYLDTLAAAYANDGQFPKAQNTIRQAIQLAPKENVGPLKHRLDLYLAQRPFRQTMGKATAQNPTKAIR